MTFDVSNLYRKGNQRRSTAHNAQIEEQIRDNMYSTSAHGYREVERLDNERLENERLDAVRDVEVQLNRNLTELRSTERENAFNPAFQRIDGQVHHYEDPHIVYDPDAPSVFYSEAELNAYNKSEVKTFLRECPDFFPDPQGSNRDTIFRYLKAHGKDTIVSSKMLHNVFERLTYLGLLIPRPEAAPAPVTTRVAPVPTTPVQTLWDIQDVYTGNSVHDQFEGYDPHGSGQRVRLTARQISHLSVDQYKTFSRVSVQSKPDYARIEDRDPSFLASQFINLGRER